MIEIENEVFTKCKNALQNVYGDAIFLSGEIINSPPEFPAVMIEEKDNYNYLDSISSLHKERQNAKRLHQSLTWLCKIWDLTER